MKYMKQHISQWIENRRSQEKHPHDEYHKIIITWTIIVGTILFTLRYFE